MLTHSRLRPSPAVRATVSDDGLVLLDVDGGLVLSSNAVGARIWQLIEQQQHPADIARQLASEFEVSGDRTESDVAAFVGDLIGRGLVVEDPRP